MSRITAAKLPLAVLTCGLLCAGSARSQNTESRREYFTPGLVVETGARRGACDVLRFTADGKHLLAVGDDKVVRVWKFSTAKGLEPAAKPVLRWRTWHESRGCIYAMALSPGDNRYVAIGGQGMSSAGGSVAVFDRLNGTTKHAFLGKEGLRQSTIWSMAFTPSGKQVAYGAQDGTVWVWDLQPGKQTVPRTLGRHAGDDFNYVKLVHYMPDGRLLSVTANGEVLLWTVPPPGGTAKKQAVFKFFYAPLFRVAVSPDGRWLAGANDIATPAIEMHDLTRAVKPWRVNLPKRHLPASIAFSPDSRSLAIGVRVIPSTEEGATFFKEVDDKVYLYHMDTFDLRMLKGVQPTYWTEAMALHPDGRHLAIAGGNDHEVTVWDITKGEPVSKPVAGPGKGLWAVALSANARYLGFKDQRNRDPATPNDRGRSTDPWKVFDLEKRRWAAAELLKPARVKGTEGSWEIRTSLTDAEGGDFPEAERRNSYNWFVKSPGGKIYRLPLHKARDWLPRCYAFLPAVAATSKGPALPVRLAVGHLWGVSVFDLTDKGPRLRRVFSGHEGEVMALAVSADGQRLVTASRDQTIAGWSLADWPGQRELGAQFFLDEGRLFVAKVEVGSPAWEAGLSRGDEILLLAVDKKLLFNRSVKRWGADVGTPEKALAALKDAAPSAEHYFAWRRPGNGKVIEQLTSVRQRPLWRFFPSGNDEWVLWRWRDYYYDTSTKGDYRIGWQRNHDNPLETPEFYPAEQFRKEFHRPERVAAMLKNWKEAPAKVAFLALEPPEVTARASHVVVKEGGVTLTLTATPRGRGDNHQIKRVLLWVNDYQLKVWEGPALKLTREGVFRALELIPREKLRQGVNLVTLQAYNRGEVRDESRSVEVVNAGPRAEPHLYGVFIGVGDYRRARPRLASLYAGEDAEAMFRLWKRRATSLFKVKQVHLAPPLLDAEATRARILKQVEALEGKVQPDDLLVFHIAGHGTRPAELAKILKVPQAQLAGLGKFLFCCPDFDKTRLRATTVDFEELYQRLVRLPCHKLLLLDACHAGDTREGLDSEAVNPVRVLTEDGLGPIILAACQPHESAYEDRAIDLGEAYGLFTVAVRRTLEERFDQADKNENGTLQPEELRDQVVTEVQRLLQRLRDSGVRTAADQQHPYAFVPALERRLKLVGGPAAE